MARNLFKVRWAGAAHPVHHTWTLVVAHADGVIGLRISLSAWWIGMHWSSYNRRLCVNLLPCVTVWITMPGGKQP